MDILNALESRRSIRGFQSKPVTRELITEILHAATRAPSGKNAQPWEFIILAGDILREIADANVAALRSGKPVVPDITVEFPRGRFVRRSQEVAKQIYTAMDIPRDDKQKRQEWWELGFRFFDAPAAIIIHFGPDIEFEHAFFDLGAVGQSICLAAMEKGLGTCITRQGVVYPEILRSRLTIPPEHTLSIAIAIGYPDWSFPANDVISQRLPVSENTEWYGFD
jgi:nitroreductase